MSLLRINNNNNLLLIEASKEKGSEVGMRPIPERFASISKISDYPVVQDEYNSISVPNKTSKHIELK